MLTNLLARRRARRVWRQATTLTHLAHLTANWLDGTLPAHITYGPNPDPETTGITRALAAVNRAGYLTTSSQPGHPPTVGHDGSVYEQRAAITGHIADPTLLHHLVDTAERAGLTVITHTADTSTGPDWMIATRQDGQPTAAFGEHVTPVQLRADWYGVSDQAHAAVAAAVQVTVVDPVWGRNDVLWPALTHLTAATATT